MLKKCHETRGSNFASFCDSLCNTLKCDTCDIQKLFKFCRDAIRINTNRFQSFLDLSDPPKQMLHFCYIVTSQVLHMLQRPKTRHRHSYSLYLTPLSILGLFLLKRCNETRGSNFVSFCDSQCNT